MCAHAKYAHKSYPEAKETGSVLAFLTGGSDMAAPPRRRGGSRPDHFTPARAGLVLAAQLKIRLRKRWEWCVHRFFVCGHCPETRKRTGLRTDAGGCCW